MSLVVLRHSHTDKKAYSCKICSREFITSGNLVKHRCVTKGSRIV